MLNHEIFAKCSLQLRIIDHDLMIAWRENARKHKEVKPINIVRRQIWEIHSLHICELIEVDHIIDNVLPAVEAFRDVQLIEDFSRVISEEFDDACLDLFNLLPVIGKIFTLAESQQRVNWRSYHLELSVKNTLIDVSCYDGATNLRSECSVLEEVFVELVPNLFQNRRIRYLSQALIVG